MCEKGLLGMTETYKYLTVARTLLEKREEAATAIIQLNEFQLNEKQCTHLWSTVRAVYDYLSSSQLPHYGRHSCLPNIFREFYVLLTRASAIVQWFSSEHSWLQAAVLQGNHRRAFKELYLDLRVCVNLFSSITHYIVPLDACSTIWRQDADMESDAQMDAESLRKTLGDLLARPALGEEDRLLAQYLLQREESLLNTDDQDVKIPQFCMVKSGYPTLGEHIGHGASGAVYKVKWLGMMCAKKHFGATDDEGSLTECEKEVIDEESVKECENEVIVLAKLNHPHIVKLLCMSEKPEVSFLMELMPMSLSTFIRGRWKRHRKGITPAAAIDMMLQIARGMEYLHEQSIVHRDLKPSNVLVVPSEVAQLRDLGYAVVKLTDFGLAKMKVRDLTKPTHKMMGTTRYRAPEAYASDRPIDWKKADAYSFAITCSEILTGMEPFGKRLGKMYARVMGRERPKLPSSCPKGVVSLLEECWDTSPSVRPYFTEIRKALNIVKESSLNLEGSGQLPRKAHKINAMRIEASKSVRKSWQCVSNYGCFGDLLRPRECHCASSSLSYCCCFGDLLRPRECHCAPSSLSYCCCFGDLLPPAEFPAFKGPPDGGILHLE